jgi:hypothetical protein
MSHPLPNIHIQDDDEEEAVGPLKISERHRPPPRTAYNTTRRRSALATSVVVNEESSSEEEEGIEPLKPSPSTLKPIIGIEKPMTRPNEALAVPMAIAPRRRSNLASVTYNDEEEFKDSNITSSRAHSAEQLSNRPQPVAIQVLKSHSSLEESKKSHQSLKSQSSLPKSSLQEMAFGVSRSQSIGDDSYGSHSSSQDDPLGTTDKKTMFSKSNDIHFGMTLKPPPTTGYQMPPLDPPSFTFKPISRHSRYYLALKYLSRITHLYNFFSITMTLAFPCYFTTIPVFVLNVIADLVLLTFLAVLCVTEYDDDYGDAVKDLRLIAKYFLIHRLGVLKMICTIPWDAIPMEIILTGTAGQCYPTQVEASNVG